MLLLALDGLEGNESLEKSVIVYGLLLFYRQMVDCWQLWGTEKSS